MSTAIKKNFWSVALWSLVVSAALLAVVWLLG